ncbi:MAG: ligase-associated DNA damage response endonuclease PdeM [Granulosicoccus sp.]
MNQFESQALYTLCAGERLCLHPSRVMYWPRLRILFAADVHAGKEHVFGRQGIALPGGISEAGLQQLFSLAAQAGAQKLVILGDFMHALPSSGESWLGELSRLLDCFPHLQVEVIAGNHDKAEGQRMVDSRVKWFSEPQIVGPFVLQHEPRADSRGFVLSGHLHPAWRIGQRRRGSIRTPVFWMRQSYAVLPAYGEFTGGRVVEADSLTDRLYMVTPEAVIEVPADSHHRRQ